LFLRLSCLALIVLALGPAANGEEAAAHASLPVNPACLTDALQPVKLPAQERLAFKLDVLGVELGIFEMKIRRAPAADRERGARDLRSGLFVLRRQPLTAGEQLCSEIFAARRMWRVVGTVAGKPEQVESLMGKVTAFRVVAVATRLDDPRVVRKAHVWITADK